ncbi:hypothetical protein [Desulfosporosinus sp. FKB]|uniref:hypothetical protein n=1 Tax=Desulfosporosinus sp. FKB TaxID=1969835 RepID=UPI0014835326|nr:hypothetical protein [Desulfosporosinus sp. FKB]
MELTITCTCGNKGNILEDIEGEGQIQGFEIMSDYDHSIIITCLQCHEKITL